MAVPVACQMIHHAELSDDDCEIRLYHRHINLSQVAKAINQNLRVSNAEDGRRYIIAVRA